MTDQKHTAEPWAQGVTLRTNVTRNWTTEQVTANNAIECRKIFSNFSATDEGKSRILVAICESEEDARRIVASVNACAGINTDKLDSWINPPEGMKGLPHGSWAQQLVNTMDAYNNAVTQRNELLTACKALLDAHKVTVSRQLPDTVMDAESKLNAIRNAVSNAYATITKIEAAS